MALLQILVTLSRVLIALLRRLVVPFRGLDLVLLHAHAEALAIAKRDLPVGIALLRRLAVPLDGFNLVLCTA